MVAHASSEWLRTLLRTAIIVGHFDRRHWLRSFRPESLAPRSRTTVNRHFGSAHGDGAADLQAWVEHWRDAGKSVHAGETAGAE